MLPRSLLSYAAIITWSATLASAADTPNTGMADPGALISAFDQYAASLASTNGGHLLVAPLTTFRGITTGGLNAGGSVSIDLTTGLVTSNLMGMPAGESFDLWFVDNRPAPGRTTLAEPGDVMFRVGSYSPGAQAGVLKLSITLPSVSSSGFLPDRAFVVHSDQTPTASFVLMGSPTVFDRLLHRQVRFAGDPGDAVGFDPMARGRELNFARLVAQGRQIFVREQFDGNGRACGTCHVENHNFTIDPDYIATLPRTDPLFVAEHNPSLAAGFEKPDLMRKFGLFIVNADGFDNLQTKLTMRSAQPVLALRNSSIRPDPSFGIDFTSNGMNADPPERLGWSNDGPPLRDFAIVAIAQHATRTLNRRAGADFRVPTDEELDALAAYQLALGRQEDFDLKSLVLKSALATKGRALFLDTGNIAETGHKNCNACHFNAGGTTAIAFNSQIPAFSPRLDGNPRGFNMSAPVNVNETPVALSLALPRDGGFGVLPTPLGAFGNFASVPAGLFPVEEFNAPPLVEAADTAPFFHNHSVADLESAVAFYGTPAFKDSLSSIGGPIGLVFVKISPDPNDPEVQAIAAFLRVLNALENIRSSLSLVGRAKEMAHDDDARDLANLALAEVKDAEAVLSAGALKKNTEPNILSAGANLIAVRLLLEVVSHLPVRPLIDIGLDQAASSLRSARSALADTSTLPASYRK